MESDEYSIKLFSNEIFKLNLLLSIHFQIVDFKTCLDTEIISINQYQESLIH